MILKEDQIFFEEYKNISDFIKKVSVKKSINSDFAKPIIKGTFTFKIIIKLKIIVEKLI